MFTRRPKALQVVQPYIIMTIVMVTWEVRDKLPSTRLALVGIVKVLRTPHTHTVG